MNHPEPDRTPAELRASGPAAGAAVDPVVAWARVAEHCRPLAPEPVALADAHGRTLAAPVQATVALPRETNSAMDGFAVRAADGPHVAAPLVGESRAGAAYGGVLTAGAVVRISTGATLPAGADAVVRVEDATIAGERVSLPLVEPGRDVRVAGEDLALGSELLPAGTRLGAHHLAALAAAGCGEVACHRRPRVSVVVTGDELVPPGALVGPGQVTDVHGTVLPVLIRAGGGVVGEVLHAPDRPAALDAALAQLAPCDVVIVTGGVSVGPHDHTRAAFAGHGVRLLVPRLLLRPGQPTAIGVREHQHQLWFGLPGNPVSAFAVAVLLLVPALRALSGVSAPAPSLRRARLAEPLRGDPTRWLALRAVRTGDNVAVLGRQGSHMVAGLAAANALVLLPPAADPLVSGTTVELVDLTDL